MGLMIMKTSIWTIGALLALGLGCAPVSGPVEVEAVVSHAGGDYALETVTVDGAVDLFAGEHEDFVVTGGQEFHIATFLLLTEEEGASDFDTVVEVSRGAPAPVTPSLYFNPLSGRWEAEDFDSLYYLTLLETFEETFRFFRAAGDDSAGTGERGLVGMYGRFVVGAELPIPIFPDADNAAYLTLADAWLAMRVHDQDGLPFGMNGGVIAHEFQHRVFFRNLFDGEGFAWWRQGAGATTDENGQAAGTPPDFLIMRGVDEGLADVFGVGRSGDVGFMQASLVDAPFGIPRFAGQARFRNLDGDFAEAATYDDVIDGTHDDVEARQYCGALSAQEVLDEELQGLSFNYYCLGTVLAKTIWDAADHDVDVLREAFLPAVNDALPLVRETLLATSTLADQFVFDIGWILEGIAVSLPAGGRRDAFCVEVERRFGSVNDRLGVPTCVF